MADTKAAFLLSSETGLGANQGLWLRPGLRNPATEKGLLGCLNNQDGMGIWPFRDYKTLEEEKERAEGYGEGMEGDNSLESIGPRYINGAKEF